MADDADGPSNNRVHYTIIDGNQGNPFTIDPTRGEIKVTKLLDREKVSFCGFRVAGINLPIHNR